MLMAFLQLPMARAWHACSKHVPFASAAAQLSQRAACRDVPMHSLDIVLVWPYTAVCRVSAQGLRTSACAPGRTVLDIVCVHIRMHARLALLTSTSPRATCTLTPMGHMHARQRLAVSGARTYCAVVPYTARHKYSRKSEVAMHGLHAMLPSRPLSPLT